ncbi:peptidase family C54-domain-containing protein [Mycena galopus ATCC 62051]|nr:peptidase family C54-domain-containing protein [Mycena galopus ATCC 62051]
MPSSSSTTPASSSTAKPRAPGRHTAAGPLSPPASSTAAPESGALSPASPPTSPAPGSKLPRFLQTPAARDRSKSLSVDRPPSVASSSASHTTNTSNSTSTSSASGRKSATRFLGIGKDKERERERQRIREVERGAPSAEELLTLHEQQDPDNSFSAPPSAYGTARPRTRSERHFSASTPPPSNSSHSGSSNGHAHDVTLARSPSRLGADGALATRLSGWFAHLAGSTSDLSLAATISGSLTGVGNTAAALSPRKDAKASSTSKKDKTSDAGATAKSGGGKTSLLDKAVRYLLDGDAAPDRSTDDIWLMGVCLPGWGPEDEARVAAAAANPHSSSTSSHPHPHLHASTSKQRRSGSKTRDASSPHATSHDAHADALDPDTQLPDAGPWPAAFHAAFYAHVWCTYRAGFEPIRDLPSLASLPPPLCWPGVAGAPPSPSSAYSPSSPSSSTHGHGGSGHAALTGSASTGSATVVPTSPAMGHSPSQSDSSTSAYSSGSSRGGGGAGSRGGHSQAASSASGTSSYASYSSYGSYAGGTPAPATSTKKKWWPLGGTKGWTSDAGWGCMLRTSQSLLATALERVGEPPLQPTPPPPFPALSPSAHALHARLLSWFLDAPAAPFGVHRMALAGKAAGKDVGMWFGPSAAAGALRMLVDSFPACGLGVSVATDGTLYQTEVFVASHSPASSSSSAASVSSHGHGSSSSHARGSSSGHAKSKESKRWGDRPVLLLLGIRLGLDGVNPIYYETIKRLYTFPQSVGIAGGRPSSSYYFVGVQGDGLFYLDPHHSRPAVPLRPFVGEPSLSIPRSPSSHGHGHPTSPSTTHDSRRSLSPEAAYARGGSTSPDSGFARAGSMSPELVYGRGGSMSPDFAHGHGHGHGQGHSPMTEDELVIVRPASRSRPSADSHSHAPNAAHPAGGPMSAAEEAYFARAYSAAEMRTFHCERVRKMPLSGLDPSMLIGFVVRDEAEWVDLRRRVKELPRTIFGIQDEPPTWPGADDDDDMGLESISDPEEADDADTGFDDGDVSSASHAPSSSVSHAVSGTASTFSHTHAHHGSNSTTHSASTSNSSGARSEEVDTEEDPVAPITPLPTTARFDLTPQQSATTKGRGGKTVGEAYAELQEEGEGDDGFVDAGGEVDDIEDDWIDPVAPPPLPPVAKKTSSKEKGASSSGKDKSGSKEKTGSGSGKGKKKKAVPVPSVHYPFPVSAEDGAGASAMTPQRERERERERNVTVSPRAAGAGAGTGANANTGGQRMHTARARDGGRTQSGGVRGILTED